MTADARKKVPAPRDEVALVTSLASGWSYREAGQRTGFHTRTVGRRMSKFWVG